MRIVFFKTPKPKRFSYQPRHFDPKKEEWERRKAELGYDSNLSKEEQLRLKMSHRWVHPTDPSNARATRLITYFVYAVFIFGSIYVILFTHLIENFLALFGVVSK
ncbi:hypothetical protein LA303_06410 [Candidatus Sulfidibacterium hydrothermale]|uniref:hypothetical protein n=1 Tax=Candidatus Sulfidibacterium hydrothermale TaxID=2875962 RepID=UPI001F0A3E44|nr:hypothetical protein [Candidatus Sulfidibacterium hydrothermale]UBM61058.1 hypothetical protein LA303_06410 [Candidatus Sulfidibacterium hydrothermale]